VRRRRTRIGQGASFWFAIAGVALTTIASAQAITQQPAFPGAHGYGRNATGWRYGRIIYVTNLDDRGEGSLRACAEESDRPRLCIFAISGTIVVDKPIFVRANVYIAGQTAPGQGVQLRLGKSMLTPLIVKNSHDVLLRFLKFRPGPSQEASAVISALLIENSHDVMVDHCAIEFATDQNFSLHFDRAITYNITLQRSTVAWGLDHANHPKGRHSKGALICSGVVGRGGCGLVTLYQNLIAHNRDRNPDIAGTGLGPIQVLNNIFYDPISQFGEFYDRFGSPNIDYVGNLTITGPSSRMEPPPFAVQAYDVSPNNVVRVHASGNLSIGRGSWTTRPATYLMPSPGDLSPQPFSAVGPLTAAEALPDLLLADVGPRLPGGQPADSLDDQLIQSVRQRTGRVIDDPSEVGGWPSLPVASGPKDTDHDGMPDDWETKHAGLDPRDRSDVWSDRDKDGWSNIEEYLSALAGDQARKF
jgi:hypothetical protein